MTDELKPCPFCGCDSIDLDGNMGIYCNNDSCLLSMCYHRSVDQKITIEWWNHRPIEDALRAELAKLIGLIDQHEMEVEQDTIATLRAELAALKEATRWIPSSEKLPEELVWVLVYWLPDESLEVGLWNGGFWENYKGPSHYINSEVDYKPYWMPLPELPEEAK